MHGHKRNDKKATDKPVDKTNEIKEHSNKIAVALISALCLIIPTLLLYSAFQNPSWVKAPITKRFESFLTGLLMGNINVVTVPTNQPIHPLQSLNEKKLWQIEEGKYSIISATDIHLQLNATNKAKTTFTIATIGPADLSGKSMQTKRKIIEVVYNEALKGNIDTVVESTESDRILESNWGRRRVTKLRKAGVIRCVIFDGGHHIGSLNLRPDILLIPTMYYDGNFYATHSFTRDAVRIEKIEQVIENEYVGSMIVCFPRLGIPVKNSSAMGKLAYQAISNITGLANQKNKIGANNDSRKDTNQNYDDYEYSPIRKTTVFISCNVGDYPSKEDILKAVKAEVESKVGQEQPVRRVYTGLTYGTNQFPDNKRSPGYEKKELEAYLLKNLPYFTEIMSEQISAWDIVRSRI